MSGAEIQATIYENLTRRPVHRCRLALAAGGLHRSPPRCLPPRRSGAGTGWLTAVFGALAIAVSIGGELPASCSSARLYVPPIAPALAFVAVAAAQSAPDYAAERRLRRGITRAFSQYLSPVLVKRLAADPAQLQLGGERKTLSILFSDVRGFTTISEALKDEPERLTTLMHRLLNPLSAVVLAVGGTIDKYIGDAIMAFWNAPLDDRRPRPPCGRSRARHAEGARRSSMPSSPKRLARRARSR